MKKPLILAALAVGVAACDLSTGGSAPEQIVRIVDSTGHPYGALSVQGHPLPFTYTSAVSHTVLNANLCLFTDGSYRFSELLETPTDINADRLYEWYGKYTLSATGKVAFDGGSAGTKGIGTDTLSYVYPLSNHTYSFEPNAKQLNQSCLKQPPSTGPGG